MAFGKKNRVAGDLIFALASTVFEIFAKKTGMLVVLFLSHWKTVRTRYTHSLRSCVALGSIKKAPEGGGWVGGRIVKQVLVYTG